jgi:hypothetical protein
MTVLNSDEINEWLSKRSSSLSQSARDGKTFLVAYSLRRELLKLSSFNESLGVSSRVPQQF